MTLLPRDLKPIVQIAHLGRWNVACPELLAQQRSAARPTRERHDPTAVLALREWLEAVTYGDTVGRKLQTWIVESGGRTLRGDLQSIIHARHIAKRTFATLCHARVLLSGPGEHARPESLCELGTSHPSRPLVLRAPHGAWELQLLPVDPESALDRSQSTARHAALTHEYAPEPGVSRVSIVASFRAATAEVVALEPAFVLCSEGSDAVAHSAAFDSAQCTVLLRVYASQAVPKLALIERLVFVRPLQIGRFLCDQSLCSEQVLRW
jgi:hypothetical protein